MPAVLEFLSPDGKPEGKNAMVFLSSLDARVLGPDSSFVRAGIPYAFAEVIPDFRWSTRCEPCDLVRVRRKPN